ncbi:L-aspartate oxidase [Rossellomorea aquimaris]|uniref:L-aspartate oxidase n=1 Tax=Rossellomorea aquimaris TaxID=189382 RepID=UPI001CD7D7C4|nr:L-aspartate oxidase [Rossellomorea aquimaris]MCA1056297.1 L-aspartate oxidase [Rossellomorea aquimaris]
MTNSDVIIIGSGISALQLARHLQGHLNVMIITKNKMKDSNSYLAQGGIAAPIGTGDKVGLHARDTITAGCGHQLESVVKDAIRDGKRIVAELIREGAPFDRNDDGELSLGMEGAHSMARILHSGGDQTGKLMIDYLMEALNDKVRLVQGEMAFELLTNEKGRCTGVRTKCEDGSVRVHMATHVVLATGGAGAIYSISSNAPVVTGDGLALAFRAGAVLADMEFIQFHPTLLTVDQHGVGLVSEAVRGEGALLLNDAGERIMEGVHSQLELAPRHIVAEKINSERLAGREVFLDITPVKAFETKFPSITRMCEQHGISLAMGKIPVSPGCHFTMGGVVTDEYGRTSVKGLYAIGEVACTGLHGANRLASNSLLEGLVYGERLASYLKGVSEPGLPVEEIRYPRPACETPDIRFDPQELKERMMMDVGIIRSGHGLTRHMKWLKSQKLSFQANLERLSQKEIQSYLMWVVSTLITQAAFSRTESRGAHIRSDFPEENNVHWYKRTIGLLKDNHQLKVVHDEQHQIEIYA